MAYLFLTLAITTEVVATISLRASEGFSRPGFAVIVVTGYIAAFLFLSMALERGLPLGIAYGIWAAAGVAAVAILSVPIFGETITTLQAGGIALVIAGVTAIELGGTH